MEAYDLSPSLHSILGNISTRSFVETGDDVMIGGFIVQGADAKRVVIRAIGPELTQYGVPDALASAQSEQPSLIVLDLMLPDIDGIQLLRRLKEIDPSPEVARRSLDEVGLFDDDFFAYFEESDLCWRLWLAGWEVGK